MDYHRNKPFLAAASLLAILTSVISFSRPAVALDSSRALTQCIHRIWQAQQGLPQGTIYCVYQTQDRYLWLGTKTGLVRFDGVQFSVIREVGGVSLENVWIRDLLEDDEKHLWIATDRDGLIRWKSDVATRFSVDDGLPSNSIRCVQTDRHGNLWVGTDRGLARLTNGQIETFTGSDTPAHEEIRALCTTSDGSLWIAGEGNRLFAKQADGFSTVTLESLPSFTAITALVNSPDGALWIGSSDGLVKFHNENQQRFTIEDGLPDNQIFCLAPGSDNSLWIGTGDGFSRLREGQFQSFRTRDGLSQSTVYSICEDHEGSLWVGTKLGLNQLVDRRTIPFTSAEGLPSNKTGPIVQAADGTIWVGTLDAGLARFNGTGFSKWSVEDGLPSNAIFALATENNGTVNEKTLWVGTEHGLCRLQGNKITETLNTENGLPSNRIQSLCCDQQGTLWIGTAAGISAYREGKLEKSISSKGIADSRSIVAIAEHRGTIVAAVAEGPLLQLKNELWKPFEMHQARPAHVSSLYSDGDTLYVATMGDGLYVVSSERTTHLSVREGLYDDELFSIAGDQQGKLWIGCSKGIFSVQKSDLQRFATGSIPNVETTPISPLDALRTVECQKDVQPGVAPMQDGRVWFSTIRGVLVVDPTRWQRVLPATSVVVEEVIINGGAGDPRQLQEVPPGNANLTFRYAALSYTSPLRITFRYKLEGFDKNWIEGGTRREAFYTNIPPGRYRFVVAATNADGKLYETAAPVVLNIPPHLYQTIWLPLAGCAALAALIWAAYRLRVRRIRQQMNATVVERSRIARELHDGLMQGFAGITMEMQALSNNLPEGSAQRETLDEIINDAGYCLREARRSIAGLRGAQSGLAAALEQTVHQLTQTQQVLLKLHVDPLPHQLSTETEYNLLRIAQEAIANALKHSSGSVVDVALENSAHEVRLIVKDDGRGFANGEDAESPGLGHYGLIGMRERARQIGAQFTLQSQPGRGTTVRVVLPTHPSTVDLAT